MQEKKPGRIVCPLLLTVIACLVIPQWLAADDSKALPGAVFNYKKWECRIDGNKLRLKVSARLTINNERGEEYSTLVLSENDFSRLKEVSMEVFDADGNSIYRKRKNDMEKFCGYDEIAVYTDVCDYYTTLGAPRYPYRIEYEYVHESNTLFAWREAILQHGIPVEKATYTLTLQEDISFHYKVYGADIEPEVRRDAHERLVYEWQIESVPPLPEDDYLPAECKRPIRVAFAADSYDFCGYRMEGISWENIGKWYAALSSDRYLEAVDYLPLDAPAAYDTAESIYNDIIASTRYVAIEIGVGGWQPYEAELTQKRGYGDCKDMSTLLVSRLRNAGITAFPCLVCTRDQGVLDIEFPHPVFNHVITVALIGEDTIWMDPTCKFCPLGEIPLGTSDIDALVVTDRGGKVRRTPAIAANRNVQKRTFTIHVDADRYVTMTTALEATGNYASEMRGYLENLDNDETRGYINQIFPGAGKLFQISHYSIDNHYDIYKPLIINVQVEWLKTAKKIGKCIYVDPFVCFGLSGRETVDLVDRTLPLDLYFPGLISDSIVVTWDSSLMVDSVSLPAAASLFFPFGSVSLTTSSDKNKAILVCRKAYQAYAVDSQQFGDFGRLCDKIKDISSGYVKLQSLTSN